MRLMTMRLLASTDSVFCSLFVDGKSRSIVLVHIILVYTHVFLLSSSLLGHDAETKYVGRECAAL